MTVMALLIPLVTAGAILLLPEQLRRAVAVLGTLGTFAVALLMGGDGGIALPWLPSFGVTFALSPDGASPVLVTVAALVMIPTVLYAGAKVERSGPFLALLLAMQAGLNGIFLARDLVVFYLFWEATLIPSLVLLGAWGRAKRREAVMKYLIYAVAGSFVMLIAVLAIKPLSGAASYGFDDLLAAAPALPVATQVWLMLGFTLGLAVKLPLWPLHSWLPDFHVQNHPSGAADVAGTLYKVGGWGFFAWALPLLPEGAAVVAPYLLVLAAFSALYAAILATVQQDLKRLLAFASLSHMGLVGVGLFGLHLSGLSGAIYLLTAQMVSTGALFLIAGMLFERKQSFDLAHYGGLARRAPALAAVALFAILASIGVPGLANFPGEFLSLLGTFQTSPGPAVLATLAAIAAGVYGVNLYQRLFQGKDEGVVREASGLELVVLAPLVAAILWLGLFPAPQLDLIEQQAALIAAPPTEALQLVVRGDLP